MPSASTLRDLQTRTILSALQTEQLERLLSHATEEHIAAEGVIFLQDKEADAFYIVREGKLQIQVPAINGPGVEVQALGEWDVISWSWLIPLIAGRLKPRRSRRSRCCASMARLFCRNARAIPPSVMP